MRRFLPKPWGMRIVGVIGVSAAIFGVMNVAGMDPQPVLLGLLIVSIAAIAWFGNDVLPEVEAGYWVPGGGKAARQRGADMRVYTIKRRLVDAFEQNHFAHNLYPLLVEIVDDKLAAIHGIDREADPDAAARVLGPHLTEFVTREPPHLKNPAYVESIVTEIEKL